MIMIITTTQHGSCFRVMNQISRKGQSMKRNMKGVISKVNIPTKYCISTEEMDELRAMPLFDALWMAFKYGFALGQRCEKRKGYADGKKD